MERTGLLLSVRDAEEAEAALAGGADLIDVKEPARGALGKADDRVIRAIAERVGDRAPVSAALGEWDESHAVPDETHLSYVKWGPAHGAKRPEEWKRFVSQRVASLGLRMVFVAYADWECAQAPPPGVVLGLACMRPGGVVLLDTHCKPAKEPRSTLLDWLTLREIHDLTRRCREAGCRIALAGSLGKPEILQLRSCRPDWFALRGAACEGSREGRVSQRLVRELAKVLE